MFELIQFGVRFLVFNVSLKSRANILTHLQSFYKLFKLILELEVLLRLWHKYISVIHRTHKMYIRDPLPF